METPSSRENMTSQIPALHLLAQLGYVPLTPEQANIERGGRTGAVLFEGILRRQLAALNRISYRGRDYAFSDTNLSAAIVALRDLPLQNGFTAANKAGYDLVTLGKSFEQVIEGDRKSYSLRYVDWERPENNVYHVVPELTVARSERTDTYRPDLLLYVNGIPMGVIECKKPSGRDPIREAINQQLDYQKPEGIRSLYLYSNLLLALTGNDARYATTNTPAEFWATWREQTPPDVAAADDARLRDLIGQPLAPEHAATVQAWLPAPVWQQYTARLAAPLDPTAQDRLLFSLCRPERLLDLIFNYIVFDDNVKKIARYQQYFTIGQTLRRVADVDPITGRRAGGVIWHTQGSGKSLTMVMLAQMLAKHPNIPNPKILLVTDRVELDDQLTETFQKCKKDVVQATTGASEKIRKKLAGTLTGELVDEVEPTPRHAKKPARDTSLLALLHEQSDDIVTTVINKFDNALKSSAEPVGSENLFILVDEAHRTQYGNLHVSMRRLFPKACFLGFTGTPLMKAEKNTARQFGGLIQPAYTITDAVADGAVVPLLYEGRHHRLATNAAALNRYFDIVAEPLSDKGKTKLKQQYSQLQALNQADQVILARALDIVEHYVNSYQPLGLKGQVVVGSKWQAVRYKKHIDDLSEVNPNLRVTCEVVISPPDAHEGDEQDEGSYDGAVRSFWKDMMDRHGTPERYEKTIVSAFKNHEVPELVIVVRKLTTGFDAPRNTVLYLTTSLKEHELLQTIARVNRVHPGKDHGLIVDYFGNLGNLDQALTQYAGLANFDQKDLEGTISSLDAKIAELPQAQADVWAVFSTIKNRHNENEYQELLYDREKRDTFYERVSRYAKLYKMALSSVSFMDQTTEQQLETYRTEVRFFLDLKASVNRRYSDEPNYAPYEAQLRKLIDRYVSAEGETLIVTPTFTLLDTEQRQTEVAKLAGQAAQADHIASKTSKAIELSPHRDEVLYRKLAEMIQETIEAYHAHRLSEGEFLQKAMAYEATFQTGQFDGTPASLQHNPVATAFFGVATALLKEVKLQKPEPFLIAIALGIDQRIRARILENNKPIVDWQNNLDLAGTLHIELDDYLIDYSQSEAIELPYGLIDQLIEGCLEVAKTRYA